MGREVAVRVLPLGGKIGWQRSHPIEKDTEEHFGVEPSERGVVTLIG